jgi:NADH-quinone oxidoreductase subunit E
MYSEANERKINELLTHYPIKRSAILPALFIAQEEHGYVTDDDVKYLAQRLEMRVNEVEEVVTFYSMYSRQPIGKYKLQVCRTVSCMLAGAEDITKHLCDKLRIKVGESTPDMLFNVQEVECLGYCDLAPVLQVNFDYHEKITTTQCDAIIDSLKSKAE